MLYICIWKMFPRQLKNLSSISSKTRHYWRNPENPSLAKRFIIRMPTLPKLNCFCTKKYHGFLYNIPNIGHILEHIMYLIFILCWSVTRSAIGCFFASTDPIFLRHTYFLLKSSGAISNIFANAWRAKKVIELRLTHCPKK